MVLWFYYFKADKNPSNIPRTPRNHKRNKTKTQAECVIATFFSLGFEETVWRATGFSSSGGQSWPRPGGGSVQAPSVCEAWKCWKLLSTSELKRKHALKKKVYMYVYILVYTIYYNILYNIYYILVYIPQKCMRTLWISNYEESILGVLGLWMVFIFLYLFGFSKFSTTSMWINYGCIVIIGPLIPEKYIKY